MYSSDSAAECLSPALIEFLSSIPEIGAARFADFEEAKDMMN
jgi:hypothetical protein